MPAPARRVAVVTDSASCVPAEQRERFGIGVVPYRLSWGRESYQDLLNIGPEEFYERFLAGPPFPTTSTPTPKDYAEGFGKAAVLATRLNIRALLRVADGRIRFVTARQSREAATDALLAAVQAEVGDDPLRVGVLHGACRDEAEALAERLPGLLNVRHLGIAELTPVMGAHAGPGTLGIGYERLVPYATDGADA